MENDSKCVWNYYDGNGKCERNSCFECPEWKGNNKEFLKDLLMEQQEQM